MCASDRGALADKYRVAWIPDVGDRVAVRGSAMQGVVKFVGETRFTRNQLWVGLELDGKQGAKRERYSV